MKTYYNVTLSLAACTKLPELLKTNFTLFLWLSTHMYKYNRGRRKISQCSSKIYDHAPSASPAIQYLIGSYNTTHKYVVGTRVCTCVCMCVCAFVFEYWRLDSRYRSLTLALPFFPSSYFSSERIKLFL